MKYIFIITMHFFIDCYLQPERYANKKQEVLRYMLTHCFVYAGILSMMVGGGFIKFLILFFSHLLIDSLLGKLFRKDVNKTGLMGWMDQALHLIVLVVLI